MPYVCGFEAHSAGPQCYPSTLELTPVLLIPMELLEKLEPLDLLPLLELLDDDPVVRIVRPESPLLPPEFENPGPEFEMCGPTPELVAANVAFVAPDPFASLCVHTPSARYVFVPGTWMATVRTTPSMRSSESIRSSSSSPLISVIR